jgi:hypothetical protein
MIFSILTDTNEQNTYAQSSNFTKFTAKDIEEAKEEATKAKLSQFFLEIHDASTNNPNITQFQISGDSNKICKSGNCNYQFGIINISLPTIEYTGLILQIDFQLHDKETQKWKLYSMTSLSNINETDTNNLIYEFNKPLGFVRLNPAENENPIDQSIDEEGWYKWWNENTWYYDMGPVEYRSGEDRLIMTGTFNGHDPPSYDSDDIQVLKIN